MKTSALYHFLFSFLIAIALLSGCKEKSSTELVKVDPAFSQYILGFNSGSVSRMSELTIKLSGASKKFTEIDKKIEEELFSFSPSVKGATYWKGAQTIVFKPENPLNSDQIYEIEFNLGNVLDVESDFQKFNYSVRTNTQTVYINTTGFTPYNDQDLEWNQFQGTLISSDYLEEDIAEKVLSVEKENKELDIKWTHENTGKTHHFLIDSIRRKETEKGRLIVMWDGKGWSMNQQGTKEIEVPALNDFKVLETKVMQQPEQYVEIVFSDPIDKDQALTGFIRLGDLSASQMKLDVKGSSIFVYPTVRQNGVLTLNIEKGIKNTVNFGLQNEKAIELEFLEVKPDVKMNTSGVILPSTDGLVLPFQAVNLSAVDVTITKIYENNIHQFLQSNNSGGSSNLTRVGKKILKKKVNLVKGDGTDYGKWNSFSLDLEELIKKDQGAIYRVTIDFKKSYSLYQCPEEENGLDEEEEELEESWEIETDYGWGYDDYYYDDYYYDDYDYNERNNPCDASYYRRKRGVTKNILASNIGLITKRGKDNRLYVAASDLRTAAPMSSVSFELFDYQNQKINSATSGSDGTAWIDITEKPFLLIASKGSEKGYLKLNDGSSLTTSHFDVGGAVVQEGIKGLIYGERGVWRPGDTLFLGFILEDKYGVLPQKHPVKLEFTNPKGQLIERIVRPKSESGFYTFPLVTEQEAMTGFWRVNVKVGSANFSKSIRIETIKPNRLKIKFDFDDELLRASKSVGTMNVKWLHGAKAKNLKAKIDVKLTRSNKGFEGFDAYQFTDPMKVYNSAEQTILDGKLDAEGNVSFPVNLQLTDVAPGLLKANFSARVFEEAGDFSVDRFSMPYSPFNSYVGIKSFTKNSRDVLLTDKQHTAQVVTVNDLGESVDVKGLEVSVYKLNWRWWWDASSNNNGSYLNHHSNSLLRTYTVDSKNGKAAVDIEIQHPDWGRYYVRVMDPNSGHSTGTVVYVDWPGWATRTDRVGVGATVLTFQSDKSSYQVGETAKITVPSGGKGRALVTVENGSKVISASWQDVLGTELNYEFEITPEMAPNAFISVAMVQPHKHENSLPIRMYGVIPISVNDPDTKLTPEIIMAEELAPETAAEIKIQEKDGKSMTYTLAIVDEGLLDITRFRTPKPHNVFYAREALGVKTWDLYDDVIGAYGGDLERMLSIGGDEEAQSENDKSKINRFKPMVRFIGPFTLKKGATNAHMIDIPNYIGSVRTMVIAGKDGAYGHAEKATPVKKPLMVLATLPRVLGPTESVKLPVTVFAMDEKVKNVNVKISANELFESDYTTSKSISFNEIGDQVINFDLKVLDKIGKGEVKIEVSGAGETASYEIELEVRNPNPPVTRYIQSVVQPGDSWETNYELVGVEGTNEVTLELSNIPPIDLDRRLRYLTRYPHGCAEQTTSGAFPQLYLSEVLDADLDFKNRMTSNVQYALNRLRTMQQSSGGFGMWPSASHVNDWVSSYIGHFMLEAERKGFELPAGMKSNWLAYQRTASQSFQEGKGTEYSSYSYYDFAQAYRLYTLAMAGKAEMGAMNRLKSNGELSDTGKWLLAAAYYLAGQTSIAEQITSGLSTSITISDGRYYHYSYGSSIRNKAIILEAMTTMKMMGKGFALMKDLSDKLSSDSWMSTQSVAYSLMAATRYITVNNSNAEMNISYEIGGQKEQLSTIMPFRQVSVENVDAKGKSGAVSIKNNGEGVIYARMVLLGTPAISDDVSADNGLDMVVRYTDMGGQQIDVSRMEQGTDFIAEVIISNPSSTNYLNDLALTQIFPSGWEIYNSRMDEGLTVSNSSVPEYQDIRDDRVYTYFSLGRRYKNGSSHKKTFKILLNSTYLGKYYLPSVIGESMYNNEINATEKGQWVEVVKPGE